MTNIFNYNTFGMNEKQLKEIGERFISLKEKSLASFAKELGTTPQTLNNIKNGSLFKIDVLLKVCELRNVSADWILFGKQTLLNEQEVEYVKRENQELRKDKELFRKLLDK
jgi:transcriptional regulator with XRE-family HTH domain